MKSGSRCLSDGASSVDQVDAHHDRTTLAAMRAQQALKIRALGNALVESGCITLDQQANPLGLSRSTCWSMLQGNHKTSGLSATVINRMLSMPDLPSRVRIRILEYVQEKLAGLYGHNKLQRNRFL